MKFIILEDWEKLIDDNDNVLIEGHRLNAIELLSVFGYDFEIIDETKGE